jgi:hypothetical protein
VYLISGFHCQIILYANCRIISRNTKVELLTTSRYFYFPILPCNEDFLELSFAYKYVYSKKEIWWAQGFHVLCTFVTLRPLVRASDIIEKAIHISLDSLEVCYIREWREVHFCLKHKYNCLCHRLLLSSLAWHTCIVNINIYCLSVASTTHIVFMVMLDPKLHVVHTWSQLIMTWNRAS